MTKRDREMEREEGNVGREGRKWRKQGNEEGMEKQKGMRVREKRIVKGGKQWREGSQGVSKERKKGKERDEETVGCQKMLGRFWAKGG